MTLSTRQIIEAASRVTSLGLAHWAMEDGDFFLPNLLFLVVSIPMVYLTYHLGKALEKDQCSKN